MDETTAQESRGSNPDANNLHDFPLFEYFCEPLRIKKRINIRLFLKVQFRMFCVLRMFVSSALFLFFYTWRDLKNQGHPATLHTTRSPAIDGMALKE